MIAANNKPLQLCSGTLIFLRMLRVVFKLSASTVALSYQDLQGHIHCIPASSAPVERLFSIAGKVFHPNRCCLKNKTFEELMFIRCNQ